MNDERQVKPGWLPPRAPDSGPPPHFEPPTGERGYGQPVQPVRPVQQTTPPRFVAARARAEGPSSALAVTSIAISAIAILLLVFSLGVGFFLCGVLAALALAVAAFERRRIRAGAPGRPRQARAAVILASIALALALVAAVVWTALDASGFSPQDLQEWLEDQIDRPRQRSSPGGGEVA